MSLNKKINELNDIKEQLKDLYKHKHDIEKQIIELVKCGDQDTDDFVTILEIYGKRLDFDRIKSKYPEVYQWGLTPKFDYKTALLSFDDKKAFWKIIDDCQFTTKKTKVQVKRKNKYGTK